MQLRFVQKDEELQKQTNELRTNLAQIDQSLKMREKMVAESQEKMVAIERKLTSLGSGGSALEGLQKDLTSTVRKDTCGELNKSNGNREGLLLEGII